MAESIKHVGPIHGERSRRHQFVSDGMRGGTIVTIAEAQTDDPRFYVELMRQGPGGELVGADLTVEEAGWLRDACQEFLDAWVSA